MKQLFAASIVIAVSLSACAPATSSTTPSATGLGFAIGTYASSAWNPPFTAFFARFTNFDGSAPSANVALTVTGPAGWNDGKPLNASIPAGSRFVARRLVPVNAVAGTYTLQARVGGQTQTARATLDPLSTLLAPGGIVVSGVSSAQVSASWNAVPGAGSYTLEVFDCNAPGGPAACVNKGAINTTATNATLSGLNLTSGANYSLTVSARSVDLTMDDPPTPAQFNISLEGINIKP